MVDTTTTVEVDASFLSELIGESLILNGQGRPYAYLAGIALGGMQNDDKDAVSILMEYFENEDLFQFDDEQIQMLEYMLEKAYEGDA